MNITRLSIGELAPLIRTQKISALQVTQAYLRRIEHLDDQLHAYLSVDHEGAQEGARRIDQRLSAGHAVGPLAGVPLALKDNLTTAGMETTCASRMLAGWQPPYDSTVVVKLRQADAVLLGKLNMDEFAMGSSNEHSTRGPCRNPWDLQRVPGGSSGGAAAAVAANLCAGALGSDTGGSIRLPAAFCGVDVVAETRLYQAERGITVRLRGKETAFDYRYFPEPDLPVLEVEEAWIARVARALPELPLTRRARLIQELDLAEAHAGDLSREKELADYFEQTVAAGAPPQAAASWVLTELLARVDDPRQVSTVPVRPDALAELLQLLVNKVISGTLAKKIWLEMWTSGRSAARIVAEKQLGQQSDRAALEPVVLQILKKYPQEVDTFRRGKLTLLSFFIGRVMAATAGTANPRLVNALLLEWLSREEA